MNALHERQNKFISKDFEELDPAFLEKGDFVHCDLPYLLGEASYSAYMKNKLIAGRHGYLELSPYNPCRFIFRP